ncbi:glycerol-3-phosphate dehydrogenase [Trichonephila clavipes]|nr:glycerol-3-phosphate dehydrogenase [Trichonephila clavipes]
MYEEDAIIRTLENHFTQQKVPCITKSQKVNTSSAIQTYAQAAISSKQSATTQTDENITKIKCPPLNLLQPLRNPNISPTTPVVTISSSTQAQLLPSISSLAATNSEPQPPIPTFNGAPSTNEMFTRIESSSSIIPTSSSRSVIQTPSDSNIEQDAKKISKVRARKRKKKLLKKMNDTMIDIKMAPHRRRKPAPEEYTTDEEDITYDVEGNEIEPHPDLVEKDGKHNVGKDLYF